MLNLKDFIWLTRCVLRPGLRFVNGYLLWITFILAAALPAALLTYVDINFLPVFTPHLPT